MSGLSLIGALVLLATVAWAAHRIGVEDGKFRERARHLAAVRHKTEQA